VAGVWHGGLLLPTACSSIYLTLLFTTTALTFPLALLAAVYSPPPFTITTTITTPSPPLPPPPPPTGDLVHAVFGASKDFCGSGLRVGVLHSRNSSLNTALGNLGYFCSPPAPLQWTLAQLLGDEGWLDGFLTENRRRMLAAYNTLTGNGEGGGGSG